MIIDMVANIGCYPFRNVPDSDVKGLLARMDKHNIDIALVSALESVMYRNVQSANELLVERLKGQSRFIGAAVINPVYPGVVEDTFALLDCGNIKAVRLYPSCHSYHLGKVINTEIFKKLMQIFRKHKTLVSISQHIEDPRERHPILTPVIPSSEEIADVIKTFQQVNFFLERISGKMVFEILKYAGRATNWYIDTSGRSMIGAENAFGLGLPEIRQHLGAAHILLGTDSPLLYTACALRKIESLNLSETEKKKIMGGNAANLLNLTNL